MKIILTDTIVPPKTYTGDPRNWPDGLYECCKEDTTHLIAVCNGRALWLEGFPQEEHVCAWNYTRIPGYTGGISSITPEREA